MTDRAWSMVTTHVPVPLHGPPDHPRNPPTVGFAASVTTVPAGYDVPHVPGHEIPHGADDTVPAPVPAIVTASA